MFEKSLSDLVRGIRAHKGNEHQYIAQCMTEIKKELKVGDASVKANAISKLTYLQMMGYDISWAAFNMIEVMSSSKFTFKRAGYLGASQCFHEGVDVVMLTTNMIRKDISSSNQYEASLVLTGLACFMTPDLARDLANDVLALMSSSRPFIRKKAIFVMYKVFLAFPDALRPAFPRLKDKLDDPDIGVQSAAVSVICELARKNPHNYLSLAPTFFKLMTNSTNNWMLIKIIKLFGALMPLEPRLGKKLVDPLTNLIHSTSAMSLLYECITTVITGLPNHTSSIQLCVSKLRLFIEDSDQNLKYLGLLAMAKILKTQPKIVQQHKDLIMECLEDKDDSIRLRALDLISGMVSKKNVVDIVKKLISHMDISESANYRDEVLSKIIEICSHENYKHITNFEWYITVLVEMTKFEGTRHGKAIAAQMLDVTIRVKDVRSFAVRQMATILENTHLFVGSTQSEGICEVLYAAAWIVGEFSEHLTDPRVTLDALLNPKVTSLPAHIQAVFVQNLVKLYASILVTAEAEGTSEALEEVGAMLVERLPVFMQSGDLEVQERACCILQLMKYIVKLQSKGAAVAEELMALFAGDLKPVAPNAQKKVPVPEGLDLDKWIYEPPPDSEDDLKDNLGFILEPSVGTEDRSPSHSTKTKRKKPSKLEKEQEEEMEKRREQRRQEQMSNPHYLKPSSKSATPSRGAEAVDVANIPVSKLELGVALVIDDPAASPVIKKDKRKKKKRRGKKGRQEESSEEEAVVSRPMVDTSMGELPEGAELSDDDKRSKKAVVKDERFNALDQNLDAPLRDDEVLPVRSHRVVGSVEAPNPEDNKLVDPKKEKKKKRKKDVPAEEEASEDVKPKRGKKKRAKKSQEGSGSLIDIVEDEATPKATPIVDTAEDQPEAAPAKNEGDMNDLDFWLSGSSKKEPAQEATPMTATPDESEGKKSKKKRGEKKSKKERSKKSKAVVEEATPTATPSTGAELMGLDLEPAKPPVSTFKELAEDDNIKMTYETRANMMYNGQVTVAVVFHNLTPHQLVSLDFNVLDSLNAKLERPPGAGSHDGVKLPFQLPPNAANECQFVFYVQSFMMPQKLRGTTTYMVKSDAGTTGEKLDFKIMLPCSAFICPLPCSQQQLANWLGGGTLCDTQSIKVQFSKTPNFSSALSAIVATLHLGVVEQIDDSASLYGCSIANHHICILAKSMGEAGMSINAKGSDSQLVSNLLDEIKAVV